MHFVEIYQRSIEEKTFLNQFNKWCLYRFHGDHLWSQMFPWQQEKRWGGNASHRSDWRHILFWLLRINLEKSETEILILNITLSRPGLLRPATTNWSMTTKFGDFCYNSSGNILTLASLIHQVWRFHGNHILMGHRLPNCDFLHF